MTAPQSLIQLPFNVTGMVTTEVIAKLSEEQKENLRKFINLYFLGEEIEDAEKPEFHSNEYREAIARTRGDWPITLSFSFDHNSIPCIKICNSENFSDIEIIKRTLNCSKGCAEDVWSLRKSPNWSQEDEEEVIALHNAGIPSNYRLLKDEC
jgi:hypothetical protein